jgi:hypothetical protein
MVVRGDCDDVFLMREKKEELMDAVAMTSLGASYHPPAFTHIPPFAIGRTIYSTYSSGAQQSPHCRRSPLACSGQKSIALQTRLAGGLEPFNFDEHTSTWTL